MQARSVACGGIACGPESASNIVWDLPQPLPQSRVPNHPFLQCSRERAGILRDRNGRVFEQIPLLDLHSPAWQSRGVPPGAEAGFFAWNRPTRGKSNRPGPKNPLLIESEHVLGELHALSKARLRDNPPRLNIQPFTLTNGRKQHPLMRPKHDRTLCYYVHYSDLSSRCPL